MPTMDQLLGQRITAVWGRFWTSAFAENADYIYQLNTGKYFRFPNVFQCVTYFEYCIPTEGHAFCFDAASTDDELLVEKLFQAQITDLLVTQDADLRSPDSCLVELSSGWYLFQESGAPIGCLTQCYVTDNPDPDLAVVSVFKTREWSDLDF